MLQSDILNEIDIDSDHFDPIYPNVHETREKTYFASSDTLVGTG